MTSASYPGGATLAELQSVFDSATTLYAWIDPMQGDPVPLSVTAADDACAVQAAREAAWGRQITVVPLDPRVPLTQSQWPYLVTLQGTDDEWLEDTLDMAQAERKESQIDGLASAGIGVHRVSWLQTSLFAEDLAAVLAPMLRVRTSAWTGARYIRLADRRVFDWLRHVAGDTRVAAQFGRLRRWVYLGACGQLAQLTHADDTVEPLRLSTDEWMLFMQGERMHMTAARWLGELERSGDRAHWTHALQQGKTYARIAKALDHAALAARRWPRRFAHDRDWSAWAALSLLHPGLEDDIRVQAIMHRQPEEGEPVETMHSLCSTLQASMLKGIHS